LTIDQLSYDRLAGHRRTHPAGSQLDSADAESGLPVPPPRLVAPVRGFVAWALVLLVDRHGPDQMVALRRLAERGRLDPAYLGELQSSLAAIREAAEQWLAWEKQVRASASGRASAGQTETRPFSSDERSTEVNTETAANLLGVSTSRVRQMMRAGEIQGRKMGRMWLVSLASVQAYRELR
jgi:excisionase family DNA binding protein